MRRFLDIFTSGIVATASIIAIAALFATPLFVFAQSVPAVDPPADPIQLLTDAMAAIGQWKALGWIGAVAALLKVALRATKLPIFDKLVGSRPWIKPAIGVGLGILVAIFGSLAAGTPIVSAVFAGIIAGLSGTGLHELFNMFSAATKAERAAGAKLAEILTATDAEAGTKYAAAVKELDIIMGLPGDDRIKALAAWGNENPPAPAPEAT